MYLNLGCGVRRHPDWTNVDAHARVRGIIVHDLRTPLPFPDNTFEIVYHSHALEHFDAEDGRRLIRECHRVLAPEGVLRVVVPLRNMQLVRSSFEARIRNGLLLDGRRAALVDRWRR